jgi:hypothetical protein
MKLLPQTQQLLTFCLLQLGNWDACRTCSRHTAPAGFKELVMCDISMTSLNASLDVSLPNINPAGLSRWLTASSLRSHCFNKIQNLHNDRQAAWLGKEQTCSSNKVIQAWLFFHYMLQCCAARYSTAASFINCFGETGARAVAYQSTWTPQ